MSKQLLLYELVTPVSSSRHRNWSLAPQNQFSFAAAVNSVPLMAVEFVTAAQEYPIVFSTNANGVVIPLVVLGFDAEKSLYVKADGSWAAKYVPAFIRRYPFVFSASDDGKTLTLCIDEGYDGFSRGKAAEQRLFSENGDRTPYLEKMLEFVNQYQGEHRRTLAYCKALADLNILEPSEAKFSIDEGEAKTLRGFHCVSREKLKAIDPMKTMDIFSNDLLELIYLHLYSLRNFEGLISRAATVQVKDKARAN